MNITVVALGKIGLPVAALYAARGHHVTGCDINPGLVEAINAGVSPITHEPDLVEQVAATVASGHLRATTDTAKGVAHADVVIVLVPLGLTDADGDPRPDFGPMDSAFAAISAGLRPGALVLLETTVPAGTTRRRFLPVLEQGGRRVGRDFFLAFSPERVQSGRIARDLATYPRVVGGVEPESTQRAAAFYAEQFSVPVHALSSAEAAEFCKLAESVYRDVNIALANEFALLAAASGVDLHEVLPAANSQPQSHIHRPGLGVGGHCIPVYPYFLLDGEQQAPLTLLGRHVNEAMPDRTLQRLAAALGGLAGRRLLVLGLTYRPGVKETAHSPALAFARLAQLAGARVHGHDPLLSATEIAALGLDPGDLATPGLDAVVLHTADPAYADLPAQLPAGVRVLLDAPGVCDGAALAAAGVTYLGIGRPSFPAEVRA